MRILPLVAYLPTVRGLWANFRAREPVNPFYASFKITSRCHFGCPFCSMPRENARDLCTRDVIKVLDNLSRSSVLMTSFEGGEPLLREDIGELLAYARKCSFYLLFTTSARNLTAHPIDEYAKNIDFFHVSIDEGHGNLDMLDILPELVRLPTQLSVQIVVTRDTVDALDWKIERCADVGANTVVIPATAMDGADDCFPDIDKLERKMSSLRRRFPRTIHTPAGYFDAYRAGKCSSASVIIASDGSLYYPCHILGERGANLVGEDLTSWLKSGKARAGRKIMKNCARNCGWYQYYAIGSYVCVKTVMQSLAPMFFQRRKIPGGC